MNKYVLIFLFLLTAVAAFGQKKPIIGLSPRKPAPIVAQQKSRVQLMKSDFSERITTTNGKMTLKVRNGVFQQDFSILRSDSALFYPDLNMVDAFGHVNITQGDTLNIYSDKLNYNGNTKIAILTDNVKMIDKEATLTTNYFVYNTATRIGTYTGGGKLVNKESTLVSKNGYYFAFSHDEYFRYNVVCTTPDAVIKTDTLRYNSTNRITYFYGPTNIYGKDKDVLYTENGTYNTATEQAFFGKNNLYTKGTKTLKGDSLFYDRLKGYGRAIKNVTFNDSEQKASVKGDLGEFYKAEEKTVMTQNPYMVFVTEDTTAAKPADNKLQADSLLKNKRTISDVLAEKKLQKVANTHPIDRMAITGVADSVVNKLPPGTKINIPNKTLTLRGITDSVTKNLPPGTKVNIPNKNMTMKGVTDSVIKQSAQPANTKGLPQKTIIARRATEVKVVSDKLIKDGKPIKEIPKAPVDTTKKDSLFLVADTLETQVITYKEQKDRELRQYQASHRDTSVKVVKKAAPIVYKKSPKVLTLDAPNHWSADTTFKHPYFFGRPDPPRKPAAPKIVKAVALPKKLSPQDSVKAQHRLDSLALHAPRVLSDTSRVRVITAHHNAKLYKSDLQAKADSMFYSSSDSTIRCYVNPIIWTQGSQLSGDTIHLQMRNGKLDNIDMFPAAFIVNVEKGDSTHFNQVGGKKMHGTFKNSKLNTMRVMGNAETIYFKRDSATNVVTDMSRTVSGIIYVTFKNGEVSQATFTGQYEGKGLPIDKTKDEDRILKNFIWKPKERPVSKESILSSYHKKPPVKKTVIKPAAKPTGKPDLKKPADTKLSKDTTAKPPAIKMGKDTTIKKLGKDSVIKDTRKPAGTKP